MTNSNYKLTKEDFKQINKRSLFTFQLGWNYERMQASGYLYMLLPQLRKMYGDGTPELKEMMKLHTQFFNTSPFFHTIITCSGRKRWCQIKRCGERDQDRSHGTIRSSWGLNLWIIGTSYYGFNRSNFGYCRKPSRYLLVDRCGSCL